KISEETGAKTICLESMRWDVGSVNGNPTDGKGTRTFLMKASSFFTELKTAEGLQSRSRVCCCLLAIDPGSVDFSADVRCTSMYDESSRRVSRAGFHCFRNSLVDF